MEADGLTFHVSSAMLWGLGFYATLISIAVISLLIPDIRNMLKGGFSAVVSKLGLDQISPTLTAFGILLWVTIFSILLLGFPWLLLQAVFDAPPVNTQEIGERRWLLVSLTALVAALGAVVALPFTLIKTRQNERQTRATEEGLITDRINNAVEGLGAEKKIDRIGRTVTLFRLEKNEAVIHWQGEMPPDGTVTKEGEWQVFSETRPNLEVRIGAILALERLARNNLDIHVQIMRILCAYIRENAPADEAKPVAVLEMKHREYYGPQEENWEEMFNAFRRKLSADITALKPREDIQVALTVLGRRSSEGRLREARHNNPNSKATFDFDKIDQKALLWRVDSFIDQEKFNRWRTACNAYQGHRLDLRNTDLQGADLSNLNFAGVRFDGARMQGVNFERAQIQGANFDGAQIQRANFERAQIHGASFFRARIQYVRFMLSQMHGVDFSEAQMQRSNFLGVKMPHANLLKAQMQGAYFFQAELQGARCPEAQMWRARLDRADMQGAHFPDAELQGARFDGAKLQGVNLNGAHCDTDTTVTAANLKMAAVRAVNFSCVPMIVDHVAGLFGDASTRLPDGIDAPDHWPKYWLNENDFNKEWNKWKADPDTYVPPDPPSRT